MLLIRHGKLDCFLFYQHERSKSHFHNTSFIYFLTYQWAQKARAFFLGKPFWSITIKQSNLLSPFVSYIKMKCCDYFPASSYAAKISIAVASEYVT